ncbi:glycosyltransferase [Geitlerinema sp. PCC 9228]|jgi:glycosyltransferase involved in cell wall biosynthesis|uniref:glycosyltransferase n=1 Tax=Geitlerinema sp. PCC 9228 TaxID=111611 RepID=UPI0008F99783|nr:glycosyltransferase [Geitlerinema sp. PCC 9228]
MKRSSNKRYYLILAPNLFGFKGGEQVYATFLIQNLQNLDSSADYDILLKYENAIAPDSRFLKTTQFYGFGRFPRFLQSFFMGWKTVWLAMTKRPHLIISCHVNYSVVLPWLQRWYQIPYWVVAHGLEAWNLKHPQRRYALRHADRVLAVSYYTRSRLLQEQSLSSDRVAVLANTIDENKFCIAPKPLHLLQRYQLTPDQPVILTVSRLGKTARYKGYDQILRALVVVRQFVPQVRYILVGKGDDTPRVQNLIQQLELQDCVTLTGFVEDEELADYYHLCDVFALPSVVEGFGIVYLEAMASGKPVLAGNRDGAVDPLVGGKLGCLVDPEDTEAIADKLIQIINKTYPNSILYEPQRLRAEILARFGLQQFRKTLEQLMAPIFEGS